MTTVKERSNFFFLEKFFNVGFVFCFCFSAGFLINVNMAFTFEKIKDSFLPRNLTHYENNV